MDKIKGGITKPKGFFASAIHSGVKKKNKDLCLIYSRVAAKAVGCFTANKIKAAPLIVSKKNLKKRLVKAIIANSGNANCMTGKDGLNDAWKMVKKIASSLSIKPDSVLVASTGVIGKKLPISNIIASVDKLVFSLSSNGSADVAKALMTTDTCPKQVAVSLKIGSKDVVIGAVAKGAGMIHPNMATMLSFVTTDASISQGALKKAFKEAIDTSFNCITVDGDMSTNDCVFLLANGLAGNKTISQGGKNYELFKKALKFVLYNMAEAIVRDAEGGTKFVKVNVKKAGSINDAKKAAYSIATSLLVKTAIYGEDPNWGRIASAVGQSGVDFEVGKLDIYIGSKKVLSQGVPTGVNKSLLRKIFKKKEIEIRVVLNKGKSEATILTNDISKKYVDINAHYTT